MDAAERQDRFKTIVALLIAAVTATGAVVAWRAALAADAANNADASGLAATINAEETRALNRVTTYEHYRAYTQYLRFNELGNAIYDDLVNASDEEYTILDRQKTEAWDLATELQESGFFISRYLNSDGSYDTAQELDEAWADAARAKDLNPDPHFTLGDRLRAKSTNLVALLIPLALALLLMTVSESLAHQVKYALAGGGTLVLVGCMAALIIIEATA
jgi:hypothetical protein